MSIENLDDNLEPEISLTETDISTLESCKAFKALIAAVSEIHSNLQANLSSPFITNDQGQQLGAKQIQDYSAIHGAMGAYAYVHNFTQTLRKELITNEANQKLAESGKGVH